MQVIQTQATVSPEGELTIRTEAPKPVVPGRHRVIVVLEEQQQSSTSRQSLELPSLPVADWPDDLTLRREEIYGDSGR